MLRRWAPSLACVLAVGIALLPIAPTLHSLTSGHAHRYCLEHQVIEEAPTGGLSSRDLAGQSPNGAGALTQPAKAPWAQHIPCAAANATSNLLSATPVRSSPTLLAPLPCAAPSSDVSIFDVIATLAQAPKHSPPPSLCC